MRVLSVLDEDPVPVMGGKVGWVPLRRRLGISAFGTNVYRAEREGDPVIEDHVESPGQEELYVVLRGRAKFDPALRRRGDALEDDTVVIAVGGWPDQPYHPLPWEPIYLAQESMRQGDWAAAADTLESEGGEHLETAILQFRLAWCHARLGRDDFAREKLNRALEINPEIRDRALEDEHLAPLMKDL